MCACVVNTLDALSSPMLKDIRILIYPLDPWKASLRRRKVLFLLCEEARGLPRFALSNPHPCQILFFFSSFWSNPPCSPFNYAVQAEYSESYPGENLSQRSPYFSYISSLRKITSFDLYRGNIVKKKKETRNRLIDNHLTNCHTIRPFFQPLHCNWNGSKFRGITISTSSKEIFPPIRFSRFIAWLKKVASTLSPFLSLSHEAVSRIRGDQVGKDIGSNDIHVGH